MKRRLLAISLAALALVVSACTKTPEQKFAQFMESANQRVAEKDFNRAIIDFRNALQEQPNKADAHFQLALAFLAANRAAEGIGELRKTTELDPNHSKAQLKLAELMIRTGDPEIVTEAASKIQDVLSKNPENSDAIYEFAATEAQLGRPEKAEELLKKLLDQSPADLKSVLGLVQIRIGQKDVPGATQLLKDFVEKNPNSAEGEVAFGGLFAALGNWSEAEVHLRAARRLDANNAQALILLGATHLKVGNKTEAEDTYKRLSQLSQPQYKLAYADFLTRESRLPEAIRELERLQKAEPNNTDTRARLVTAYAGANRRGDAEKLLAETLAKNAKDLPSLIQRSALRLDEGRYDEAEKDVNTIYGIDPGSTQARYIAARIAIGRRDFSKARTELAKILETNPDAIAARLDLVRVLLDSNAAEAAQQTLKEAPANQRQNVPFVVMQTWVWIVQGNHVDARKAVDALLKAVRLPDVLIQDGLLRIAARDLTGARAPLEEALRANPEDVRALGALTQTYAKGTEGAATEKLRSIVTLKPESFRLQMFWAQWLLTQGKAAEAKTALLAAKKTDAKQSAPDVLLARLDINEKNFQAARERLKPVQTPDAYMLLAGIEELSNNQGAAIDLYTKVIAQDSRNVIALNNLAFSLSRNPSRLDEALKYAQSAKELAPENSYTLDTLGWIYYRKGLFQLAVKELESALAAEARPAIQYHLGLTYQKTGNNKGDRLVSLALAAQPDLIKTQP